MSNLALKRLPSQYKSWESFITEDINKEYRFKKKIVISDCDGILTDGNIPYDGLKKPFKIYGCHDKEMVHLMSSIGWEFLFVTNDKGGLNITSNRIVTSLMGARCKFADPEMREELVKKYVEDGYYVVFCGDSPSDVKAASYAHLACTTINCFEPVQEYFKFVSRHEGGHGGFAEILWYVLKYTKKKF